MHPHTKQQLERFDKQFAIGQGRKWIMTEEEAEEVKAFIQQALLSQAEYIRAEMVPLAKKEDCNCDGSGKDFRGYCDCGFSYNDCRDYIVTNLDNLINSFK